MVFGKYLLKSLLESCGIEWVITFYVSCFSLHGTIAPSTPIIRKGDLFNYI
ncbi:hypothetical protein BTH41_05192 [Bacillus mycoides]|nr:hypothetical protein BTH41_05192 [Bacillus mycoides]